MALTNPNYSNLQGFGQVQPTQTGGILQDYSFGGEMGLGENATNGAMLGSSALTSGAVGASNSGSFLGDLQGGKYGSMAGWGAAFSGIGDLTKAYMSMKNYGLGKDQLAFQKDAFERNFAEQKKNVDYQRNHHAASVAGLAS